MPLGLVATIAIVWAGVFVFALPFVAGLCRAAGRRAPVPPARRWAPDAAFADRALADDAVWAGVEDEWHAFVDGLPVVDR